MNLNFKTHFPWPGADGKPEPTYFKERIHNQLAHAGKQGPNGVLLDVHLAEETAGLGRKLHTIRRIKDGEARFREGMKLTFSTGPRFKPERFGEATCQSIQLVNMQADPSANGTSLLVWVRQVMIEPGYLLDSSQLFKLAENDGLTLNQFVKWFTLDLITNGPGEYVLVHWTDLRY